MNLLMNVLILMTKLGEKLGENIIHWKAGKKKINKSI